MITSFSVLPAWGFSLGSMQVNSVYGERFNARILLSGQIREDFRVTIGSPGDYRKLGLKRPDFLKAMYIKMPLNQSGGESSILLQSDKPLFYPSFNLVIKAQSEGQTWYENYFLAVDFGKRSSHKFKADRSEETPSIPTATENNLWAE